MQTHIQEREAELRRAKERLEERVRDRTEELQALNEELKRLVATDPLTRLANRRGFFEHAKRALSRMARKPSPLCVAVIDLDYFKSINDTYGHAVGDMLLEAVGSELKAKLRKSDVVARIGGEEFAVLLFDTEIDDAFTVLDELRESLAALSIDGGSVPATVTVSIGVAQVAAGATDISPTLAEADDALYRAKAQGRDRVVAAPCEGKRT